MPFLAPPEKEQPAQVLGGLEPFLPVELDAAHADIDREQDDGELEQPLPKIDRLKGFFSVTLKRVVVIPDELDVIAATVRDFHQQFDVVFTSGGIGPTHDDITIEGVARALQRKVIRPPVLEEKLRV